MTDFHVSSSLKKGGSKKKKSCSTDIVQSSCSISTTCSSSGSSSSGGSSGISFIGMVVPDIMSVTPSSISSTGTFIISLDTQIANTVLAGPVSGANAIPTFRNLVAADIPVLSALNGSLNLNQLAQEGATLNQALIWNGVQFAPATLSGSVPSGSSIGDILYWTGAAWASIRRRKYGAAVSSGNTFNLPTVPNSAFDVDIYYNGQLKTETLDYTIVSNTITFLTLTFTTGDYVTAIYYN